jgi:hypothetical protein
MAIEKKKLGIILLVLGAAALLYVLFSKKNPLTSITGLPIQSAGGGGSSILAPISQPNGSGSGAPAPTGSPVSTPPGFVGPVQQPATTNLPSYNVFTSDPSATVGLATASASGYSCPRQAAVPAYANETGQVNCVDEGSGFVDWTG